MHQDVDHTLTHESMFFVNCFKYIALPFMVQSYGVATHMGSIDASLNGIRQCDEFCAFHIDHTQLGQQKHIREHLYIQLLRYLTYALEEEEEEEERLLWQINNNTMLYMISFATETPIKT